MPQRITGIKKMSPEIQGDDSWIIVKPMTVGQYNRNASIFKRAQEGNSTGDDLEKESRELYSEIVLDWNWVDDDGQPLPKPHNNPDVFELLNMVELEFVGETAASANTTTKKNGTK